MLLAEYIELSEETEVMPSLNHSWICAEILRQLFQQTQVQALPELTLELGGQPMIPDISVFAEPLLVNLRQDQIRVRQVPMLAIEVVSPKQPTADVLEKARQLQQWGVPTVWVVEPTTEAVIVLDQGQERVARGEVVSCGHTRVDFSKIFVSHG
jgi:Uma2 family endonuclease